MILNKALLLKGLGGLTALVGTVGLGVAGKKIGLFGKSIDPVLKELIEKVGLSCNLDNICTLKTTGKINIKQDQDKSEIDAVASSTSPSGKIKVYKLSGEDTEYNKKFKFVIEEGDITVGSGSSKKLEQFETYEIKEEGTDPSKKWYFSRKKKAEDEIKRLLGLPTDSSCSFPTTSSSPTTCSGINGDQLKAINFEGKKEGGTTIANSGSATLKISITSTEEKTQFPLGYKFAFDPTGEVTISTAPSNKIAKKSDTEFKIKVTPSSDTTPVSLSLEKAWTVTTLAAKVGLVCPDPSNNGEKKCSFTDGSINVKNDSDKIEGAKVKEGSTGKKMSYQEDQENYNQGIKFYLEGDDDITLTSTENGNTSQEKKICKKGGDSGIYYEIKKDESDSKWYLTKKTTTGSSS